MRATVRGASRRPSCCHRPDWTPKAGAPTALISTSGPSCGRGSADDSSGFAATCCARSAKPPHESGLSRAFLSYRGTVQHRDDYTVGDTEYCDVAVVRLTLEWTELCGPSCVVRMVAQRTVLLDSGGRVVRVLGDGETLLWLS